MLFSEMMRECTMRETVSLPDGEGGTVDSVSDGASFRAAVVRDSSAVERVAEKQGSNASFTVTSDIALAFGDVFRCCGVEYRVTARSVKTPDMCSFSFFQCSAEETGGEYGD